MIAIANEFQMAKRMKFSVIGLPHYTIWHLYEPSVDDLRHMEEMEQERLAREQEEKERTEQTDSTKPKSQSPDHIVDGETKQGSAGGPVAHPEKEEDSAKSASDTADQAKKAETAEKIERVKP
jgi:mannan polymerase II complex ANP1 subunit